MKKSLSNIQALFCILGVPAENKIDILFSWSLLMGEKWMDSKQREYLSDDDNIVIENKRMQDSNRLVARGSIFIRWPE